MEIRRRWALLGPLAAVLGLGVPAAAQQAAVGKPWDVSLAVVKPARPAAPSRVPSNAGRAPAKDRRQEAFVDAHYRLSLLSRSHLTLRYRGSLARDGRGAPRDRQLHAPALLLQQDLAEGWTARLGWEERAHWAEAGAGSALSSRGHGFAELRAEPWEGVGLTTLRYELWRSDLLAREGPLVKRQRLELSHTLPPADVGEALDLRLTPGLALRSGPGGAAPESDALGAVLRAALVTDEGARLEARLAYERRIRRRGDARDVRRRASALHATARLQTPLGERLRLELELGGRRVGAAGRGASPAAFHGRTGVELRF